MIKGRGAITDGKGNLTIDDITISEDLAIDEVLVEIKASGVCHTDMDSLHWGKSVLGHEGAGIVRGVGSGVKSVNEGDRVVLNWAIPCGQCFHCIRGEHIVCEDKGGNRGSAREPKVFYKDEPIGQSFQISTMASHTVITEAAVTKINVDIPLASACLIGCGVMTGYGAVVNVAQLKPGESVTVIGVGGVGLNAIQGARVLNAETIIAVDINPKNLELAKKFGATHTILAKKDDHQLINATEEVRALTQGRGSDYTFECSGVPSLSMVPPLAMVRPRGNAYLLSNIEHEVDFSMLNFTKDRSYMRPTYGWCHPQVDFPAILNLYEKGEYLLDEMVTTTYNLDDLDTAFKDMMAGKNARGVVVF